MLENIKRYVYRETKKQMLDDTLLLSTVCLKASIDVYGSNGKKTILFEINLLRAKSTKFYNGQIYLIFNNLVIEHLLSCYLMLARLCPAYFYD
ncbi:MAG: hypothetical protein LE169_02240 [Endomicrobium sp.]|nr:hypothetical protein [Endomicrobium sp.]